jgi:hypothetical protein
VSKTEKKSANKIEREESKQVKNDKGEPPNKKASLKETQGKHA